MNATIDLRSEAPAALDIGVQRLVGLVEVTLEGSLAEGTVSRAQVVLEELLVDGTSTIDVDCTELVGVDGFGLALLLDASSQLRGKGGALVLRYPQPAVLQRLRDVRLDHLLLES